MKTCKDCGEEKTLAEFSHKGGKPTLRCRKCHSAYYKQYYLDNPDKYEALKQRVNGGRIKYTAAQYNMTEAELVEFRKRNSGMCELCNTRPGRVVDHDHGSGIVRGFLCGLCNTGLGALGDSLEGLERAVIYLKKFENRQDNL
jgi:hypothetical protein